MSGASPEVLFGLNQGPERFAVPSFHLLQERTYLRPATLSSWLKQTILLCYKQADQQALDLVQVKAHDIRAFMSSKVFYGGVSVEQIMQAFRQRQQHVSGTSSSVPTGPRPFPSEQSSSERKEGGRGHIRYNQVLGVFPSFLV